MSNLVKVTILLILATSVPRITAQTKGDTGDKGTGSKGDTGLPAGEKGAPSGPATCPSSAHPATSSCTCDATAATLREEIQQLRELVYEKCNKSDPTIAFQATLPCCPEISEGTNVKFNNVMLDEGGTGYDSSTGIFTVPDNGTGLYYFFVHLVIDSGIYAEFELRKNDLSLCALQGDNTQGTGDYQTATCGTAVVVGAGDEVFVRYIDGSNEEPLHGNKHNGYTGFLLKHGVVDDTPQADPQPQPLD